MNRKNELVAVSEEQRTAQDDNNELISLWNMLEARYLAYFRRAELWRNFYGKVLLSLVGQGLNGWHGARPDLSSSGARDRVLDPIFNQDKIGLVAFSDDFELDLPAPLHRPKKPEDPLAIAKMHEADMRMAHGTRFEPKIRKWYMEETGHDVLEVGTAVPREFDGWVGASTDGMVDGLGGEGLVEFKAPGKMYPHLFDLFSAQEEAEKVNSMGRNDKPIKATAYVCDTEHIKPQHLWQMYIAMFSLSGITPKKWVDYCVAAPILPLKEPTIQKPIPDEEVDDADFKLRPWLNYDVCKDWTPEDFDEAYSKVKWRFYKQRIVWRQDKWEEIERGLRSFIEKELKPKYAGTDFPIVNEAFWKVVPEENL